MSDFIAAWKSASSLYTRDSWQFNKYIWENWYCQETGGHPNLAGYIKALDAQAETFIKGVTSWGEGNIFSRTNLIYFTAEEVNKYWTCGTSGFNFSRNASNEQERFTTEKGSFGTSAANVNVSGGTGYTKTVTVGSKQYKVYDQTTYESNISSSGCSISAEAIVASGYGKDYTPKDMANRCSNSYPRSLAQIATDLTSIGINSTSYVSYNSTNNTTVKNEAINKIDQNLKAGKPVIILVRNGGDSYYTRSAHYIVLVGYAENGNPSIADSYKGQTHDAHSLKTLVEKYMYYESSYEQGYVLINN